jgi:hypothetical protein
LAPPSAVVARSAEWKTSASFEQALQQSYGITWKERTLRDGLERLAQETGVAIFLDRRIDPDQELNLQEPPIPLETLVSQIAAAAKAQISRLGPVIYIGPPETADELATVAALRRQELARLPTDRQAALLSARPLQWPELTEPRQLIEQLSREAAVQVENTQDVPHDLWPAVDLPPLAWCDRLTLVLAGFGLTFQLDASGREIRLRSIEPGNVLERRYSPAGSAANLSVQLKHILSDAKIRAEQGQLIVTAREEDHDKIQRLLAGQSVRASAPAKAPSWPKAAQLLMTLSVKNQPAGAVVRKVAESLGKRLTFDESILEKLKTPITFDLKNATPEHLLDTTLHPLGLSFRLTEKELIVTAAH